MIAVVLSATAFTVAISMGVGGVGSVKAVAVLGLYVNLVGISIPLLAAYSRVLDRFMKEYTVDSVKSRARAAFRTIHLLSSSTDILRAISSATMFFPLSGLSPTIIPSPLVTESAITDGNSVSTSLARVFISLLDIPKYLRARSTCPS